MAFVSADDGVYPSVDGGSEISGGKGFNPTGLEIGIVPQNVVAADGNSVLFAELKHGVGDGVVLDAGGVFVAVPFHFVCECCDGESVGEPFLEGGVMEDFFGNDGAEGEAPFGESKGDFGAGHWVSSAVDCSEFHFCLAYLQTFDFVHVSCKKTQTFFNFQQP